MKKEIEKLKGVIERLEVLRVGIFFGEDAIPNEEEYNRQLGALRDVTDSLGQLSNEKQGPVCRVCFGDIHRMQRDQIKDVCGSYWEAPDGFKYFHCPYIPACSAISMVHVQNQGMSIELSEVFGSILARKGG